MAAVTPSFDASALSALASRMLDVDSMPWESTRFPGIEIKTLLKDTETGLLTTLVKMAPGARLPDHEHIEIEQTWITRRQPRRPRGRGHRRQLRVAPRRQPARGMVPGRGPVPCVLLQAQPVLRHRRRRRHLRPELRRLSAVSESPGRSRDDAGQRRIFGVCAEATERDADFSGRRHDGSGRCRRLRAGTAVTGRGGPIDQSSNGRTS